MRKGPSAPSSYVCRVKGSGAGRGRRAKTMGDFRSCRDLFLVNCIYSKMDRKESVFCGQLGCYCNEDWMSKSEGK